MPEQKKSQAFQTLSQEQVFDCGYYTIQHETFTQPNGGVGDYHYVATPGSVFMIAVNEQEQYALVKQFRYVMQAESIEFPGGGLKSQEDPAAGARREFEEETGWTAQSVTQIGWFNPFNGVTNERCTLFVLRELSPLAEVPQQEVNEHTQVQWFTHHEVDEMIKNNTIWDGMTLAAWQIYNAQHA